MKKLKPQRIDFQQIGRFIAGGEKKLAAGKRALAIDEETAYQLAYEAMLKASLGLMLSFGVRPRSLPGHHVTIIQFAGEKLGQEFRGLIALFNRMRRKRHEAIYDVTGLISRREAEQALQTAESYIAAIKHEVQSRNPQARLF